jgi:hypothetical protein
MKIIVHGNPIDGLQFLGPFNSDFDIPERFTEPLDEWWIATLDEPDRSIPLAELTTDEQWNLEREGLEAAVANVQLDIWRDEHGIAWAHDNDTSTTYDLTNGLIPPTE